MFTGAVYLCSILHFAPAEPPASYIKTLMILTNALPFGIGLAYLIIRTIYEPSPLNLLIKLPYYYFVSDTEKVDYLWKSELSCWILHSPNDFIELIVEIPNYIFVVVSKHQNNITFNRNQYLRPTTTTTTSPSNDVLCLPFILLPVPNPLVELRPIYGDTVYHVQH